jgi:uncharacterized protein (DUF1501 family)
MDNLERGAPGQKSLTSGWLARHLGQNTPTATQPQGEPPFRAVGFGALLQGSLRGGNATAITSLESFTLQARPTDLPRIRAAHGQIYQGQGMLAAIGQQTLAAIETIERITSGGKQRYQPADGARYPATPFGKALMQIAQLTKADVGLEVACADIGDWDTHINQGGADGEMAANLQEFAEGLSALYTDLAEHLGRVTIVTMSEFGRRVAENGGGGTDHGHGNVMFALGGAVQGGKVYGQWPGLAPEQRYGPGDLAITTDFRDVLGELLMQRRGVQSLTEIFPGYTQIQRLGLFRAAAS